MANAYQSPYTGSEVDAAVALAQKITLTPVVVSGATPTIANLSGGTIYNCGTITSLTVTAATMNSVGDIIHFTTAPAIATNAVSLPPNLIILSEDRLEGNAVYDILVCDGRVIIKKVYRTTT